MGYFMVFYFFFSIFQTPQQLKTRKETNTESASLKTKNWNQKYSKKNERQEGFQVLGNHIH